MKITLEMIAEAADASVSTVSRALNGHPAISASTASRVRDAARKLNFPFREHIGTPHAERILENRTIGIVSLGMERSLLALPAVAQAINGAEAELARNGARVMLAHVPDLNAGSLHRVSDMAGIVVAGCSQGRLIGDHQSKLLGKLRQLPTVWLLARPDGCWGDAVGSNDFETGQLAASYFMQRGHRRLAFLNPKPEHAVFLRREAGFVSRGRALGAEVTVVARAPDAGWSLPDRPALTTDAVDSLVHDLLLITPQPTALFAAADSVACAVYRALAARGLRVGQNLSLLSANNDESLAAGLYPQLTTFDIHAEKIGRAAVNQLARRLIDPDFVSTELLLSSSLVERESVSNLS